MKIGYARVSTKEQELVSSIGRFDKSWLHQNLSGKNHRGQKRAARIAEITRSLREGDTVIIWKLDRLGRSLKDLVSLINDIQGRGAGLKSLNDAIDTSTPSGKLTFHLFAALAEFERDIIRELWLDWRRRGREAVKVEGRKGCQRRRSIKLL